MKDVSGEDTQNRLGRIMEKVYEMNQTILN
jgi:hypothetical protein